MAETVAKIDGKEIVATRVFDAPMGIVYGMWTNPDYLIRWWGPDGFKTTMQEMDLRPGGVMRLVMHGPDGRDYKNKFVFVEVEYGKLVYKHVSEKDVEQVNFESTVIFKDKGDNKTEITMRIRFPSVEALKENVEKYHSLEGARQTLERLASELAPKKELRLTRTIDAPRELVWKAWTDPKIVAKWWGPRGVSNPVCEVDAKPGGQMYIVMLAGKELGPAEGMKWPMKGTFKEVKEPSRLVFTGGAMDDVDRSSDTFIEHEVTVDFEDLGGKKTRMNMHLVVKKSTGPRAPAALQGMEMGWNQQLDKLVEMFAAGQ